MRLLKLSVCPRPEALFELVSMPGEMSFFRRSTLKVHNLICKSCAQKAAALSDRWARVFAPPEMDITPSLLRVYSRLQADETLVFKGWKLNQARPIAHARRAAQDWIFRGSVAFGALALAVWVIGPELVPSTTEQKALQNASAIVPLRNPRPVPYAQIRTEDKNRIKVHYVQPELLQSMEFETIGQR